MIIVNKAILKDTLSLLPKETPKKLILLILLQVCIFAFDIMAILLLGIATKLGLDYVQNQEVDFPATLAKVLRIESAGFEFQIVILFALTVTLFSIRTFVSIWANIRIFRYLANQASYASKRIVEKMFQSKPESIISKKSQEFLYGITLGIDNLTLNFLGSITIFLTEIVFLFAILSVIIIVQPVTGLVALAIFALATLGINKLTSDKAREYSSEVVSLSIRYNKKLLETLLIYRELFLRNKEIVVVEEVQTARSKTLVLRAQLIILPIISKYLFELTLILGGGLTALIQVTLSDTLTAISSVAIFLAAASRILPSLIRAQGSYLSMRQSEGNSEVTIHQLRELEKENTHTALSSEIIDEVSIFSPKLKINNLSFAHDNESNFELRDINFEISAGQFVAIVGESGAGKTTLIDLMLGMLSPSSGSLEISGLSPLDAIHKWPGKIAYVPQDITIIDGSIKKNVALEEAYETSNEDVLIALEKSHLKNDVLSMKDGLNEIVGERGIRLSGGQRQRLGIARALFTKPEMIIFDEATSALDPLTEKTVTEAIYKKQGNTTLIVVAHRLSTVKYADLVVLLDNGKVVAKGTFDEVRGMSPKFDQQAKLVNL